MVREVADGGVGLSTEHVELMRREEIDGAVLFDLVDAELEKIGLVLAPRKKILAAIDRIRGLPCTCHGCHACVRVSSRLSFWRNDVLDVNR